MDRIKFQKNPSSSYPGIWKYPTDRDKPFRTAEDWLAAKRNDDDIGSLWRVFDKLYDLDPFVASHPGGSQWIEMSRGTDITEAFVSSHMINTVLVTKILEMYFVKEATSPRISPFTLKPNGFYMTLKRRAEPILQKVGTGPTPQILLMQDALVVGFILFAGLAAYFNCWHMALIAGVLLTLQTNGAHNFVHLKENWRRYYFDLSFVSSYEWRIAHNFSHHMYPNTVMDAEILTVPWLHQFFPNRKKTWIQRKFPIVYTQLFFFVGIWFVPVQRFIYLLIGKAKFRSENLLPLLELIGMISLADCVMAGLQIWLIIHFIFSVLWLTISITAAHHHPEIFHDGDEPLLDPDFGIGQLDATRDRSEDLFQNLFITLVAFGNHPLHHLFPTVCHSKLHYLKKVFEETAQEFNLDCRKISQVNLYFGCFQQLARTEINYRRGNDKNQDSKKLKIVLSFEMMKDFLLSSFNYNNNRKITL